MPENKHGRQSLKITSDNAISSCLTRQNTPRLLKYIGTLSRNSYARPAILKAENALGARSCAVKEAEDSGDEIEPWNKATTSYTAVKRPKRFSFYLVGFYLMLSGNMGKDV